MASDAWVLGDAYEAYIGRWSRLVAAEFLERLAVPPGRRWLDVGCGTGALAASVVASQSPQRVTGVDPSAGFLRTAQREADARLAYVAGDARALPFADRCFDAVVSGLALNFVPDPPRAAAEIARVTAEGGLAAAYVWDYREGMAMLKLFWEAAAEVDEAAAAHDEGRRFPLCQPDPLRRVWTDVGLRDVEVEAVEVPMVFADFDDFWRPFLGQQGPAPAYVAALEPERRDALRELLRGRLPYTADNTDGPGAGSIHLTARAWAVRGSV